MLLLSKATIIIIIIIMGLESVSASEDVIGDLNKTSSGTICFGKTVDTVRIDVSIWDNFYSAVTCMLNCIRKLE